MKHNSSWRDICSSLNYKLLGVSRLVTAIGEHRGTQGLQCLLTTVSELFAVRVRKESYSIGTLRTVFRSRGLGGIPIVSGGWILHISRRRLRLPIGQNVNVALTERTILLQERTEHSLVGHFCSLFSVLAWTGVVACVTMSREGHRGQSTHCGLFVLALFTVFYWLPIFFHA